MLVCKTKRRLRFLSQLEYRILDAIAHRIAPGVVRFRSLDLAWKIDIVLSGVSKHMGQEFKLLLLVFEYGTPLLGPSFKRFTQMSEAEQDRYLNNWAHSRLPFKRLGFQALRRSVLGTYYGSRRVWSRISYGGPWLRKGYPYDYAGKEIVKLHGH